jgi:hypothetical protein
MRERRRRLDIDSARQACIQGATRLTVCEPVRGFVATSHAQICGELCGSSTRVESVSALNPVDVGACHGMTLGEIRQMLGQEQLQRMRKHPGTARLPGGESQFVSCQLVLSLCWRLCLCCCVLRKVSWVVSARADASLALRSSKRTWTAVGLGISRYGLAFGYAGG